jgi:hypothetical protein
MTVRLRSLTTICFVFLMIAFLPRASTQPATRIKRSSNLTLVRISWQFSKRRLRDYDDFDADYVDGDSDAIDYDYDDPDYEEDVDYSSVDEDYEQEEDCIEVDESDYDEDYLEEETDRAEAPVNYDASDESPPLPSPPSTSSSIK